MTIDPMLHDLVLSNVPKGDQQRRAVEYVCRQHGQQDRISLYDISANIGVEEANVPPLMSRLRDQFMDFSDYHPKGRLFPNRVVLTDNDPGNYALSVEVNSPPTDMVSVFWNRHSGKRVAVVFPELPCFRDSIGTRFQNPAANFSDQQDVFGYLDIPGRMSPGCGFVAAPVVRAVFGLSECYSTWGVAITPKAARPTMDSLDTDSIVLATPSSMPLLLANLEAVAPMQTTVDAVRVRQEGRDTKLTERLYRDTPEAPLMREGTELQKYAVLTRHHYRFQRTLTVIAANDEVAIEALVPFLTNEETMLALSRELRCRETFPDHFQALFCLHLFKGHPFARHTSIVRAIDLTKQAAGRSVRNLRNGAIEAGVADQAGN